MNIAVGSMWRDSARYIDRSLDQFTRLHEEIGCRFLWVESSSSDDTYTRLDQSPLPHELRKMDDDCPWFPSVDSPERWRHLAWLSNGILELVDETVDVFVYVESDLAWEPSTVRELITHLDTVDVVSPLNTRADGYYDIWGSVGMDGRNFTRHPPYHPDLLAGGLVEVESLAGCTAMTGDVARLTRFHPEDCYKGWNRSMRLSGYHVWCDPTLSVVHD